MGFGLFLGIFLLLIGLSILLRIFTGIDLPLGRIALGIFLIYIGVRVLTGSSWTSCKHEWREGLKNEHSVVFGEGTFKADAESSSKRSKQFQIVFGKGTIDLAPLAALPPEQRPESVEINVVFGEAVVLLDPATDVLIHANSAFGEARMPNGDLVAFGSMNQSYPKPQATGALPVLKINGNVVFGSLRFKAVTTK